MCRCESPGQRATLPQIPSKALRKQPVRRNGSLPSRSFSRPLLCLNVASSAFGEGHVIRPMSVVRFVNIGLTDPILSVKPRSSVAALNFAILRVSNVSLARATASCALFLRATQPTDLLPEIHAVRKLARQLKTSDAAGPIFRGSYDWVLREHESDAKTVALCRNHGISDSTFYNQRSKDSVMAVSEAAMLYLFTESTTPLAGKLACCTIRSGDSGDERCACYWPLRWRRD
jgi:hypothetical protein